MTSEVEATRDLVEQMIAAQAVPFIITGPNSRQFLVCPSGDGCWGHDEIQPRTNEAEVMMPKLVTQAVSVQAVDSIIEYVNRFKNHDSVLFADIATSNILGIIDYHQMPPANMPMRPTAADDAGVSNDYSPKATLTKHSVNLKLPFSLEWQTWTAIDGRLMRHVDFSNFLEENAPDILPLGTMHNMDGSPVEDAPSTLFELVRELQIRSSYGAASVIRNGDYTSVEMQKGDDVSTKRNVALPLSIDLAIPVYFGEAAVPVKALIRRKVDDGALMMGIKLVRPEQARQDEFKRIVGLVTEECDHIATVFGKPA